MKFRVIDCESDGLLKTVSKIHILGWTDDGTTYKTTTDYEEMKKVLTEEDTLLVCHNGVGYDMRVFNKLLGISLEYTKFVDSLAISWFLYPDRNKHGLESWGTDVGVSKVKVEDSEWELGDSSLMKSRVSEDVKINWKMWEKANKRLDEIYGSDVEGKLRFLRYLSFKMDCLAEQEENPLKIDRTKAKKHYDELHTIVEEQTEKLRSVMPKKAVTKTKEIPKVLYKKDGSLSSHGKGWFDLLRDQGLPEDTTEPVTYIVGWEEGNPNSDPQLKEWLFSLGWEPCTYKFVRDKSTGDERKIPQVRYYSQNDPRKGELTDSVKALVKKIPELEALDGLTMSKHRMNIFKAFLTYSDEDTGLCAAGAGGFTNTLRFKHRNPFVNMPKADGEVPWGVEIRGCIVAPEGYEMCGSDVVSLEATTKRHYMYPHDPEYADAMGAEGFDEHLDLAIHAGALTEEEIETKGKSNPEIKSVRKQYKATNYSAIYGVGATKLARELFTSVSKAALLLEAYWERNWAIKKVSEEQYIKTLKDGSLWLKNPVSGFYYSLRYMKDTFSTLNQGTGVFIFDSWLLRARRKGIVVQAQMHDEVLFKSNPSERSLIEDKLNSAMEEVNKSLNLNVEVKVDIQFGGSYSEVH